MEFSGEAACLSLLRGELLGVPRFKELYIQEFPYPLGDGVVIESRGNSIHQNEPLVLLSATALLVLLGHAALLWHNASMDWTLVCKRERDWGWWGEPAGHHS